jgi:putative transposase
VCRNSATTDTEVSHGKSTRDTSMFELFDRNQEFNVRQGTLPHWYQPGVTYFVTFRTEDSVPQPLIRAWHSRRDDWLREHHINPLDTDWRGQLHADPALELQYHARFTRPFMEYLDRGYGACCLREQRAAKLVANALQHFNGDRYHLGDFVVMPNHVHLLVCLLGSTEIESQCKSWKRFSATEINRLRDTSGRFWQEESFDHVVRSPEQFEYFERYIADNPNKARLETGNFLHYVRPR